MKHHRPWRLVKLPEKRLKDLLGRYDVPMEAVELVTDIERMEQAKKLLSGVRVESMGEDFEVTHKSVWQVHAQIDVWLGYARATLKRRYLARP